MVEALSNTWADFDSDPGRASTAVTSARCDLVFLQSAIVRNWLRAGGNPVTILPVAKVDRAILFQAEAYVVAESGFPWDGENLTPAYPAALYLPIIWERTLAFARIVGDEARPRVPGDLLLALDAVPTNDLVVFHRGGHSAWRILNSDDKLRVFPTVGIFQSAAAGFKAGAVDLSGVAG